MSERRHWSDPKHPMWPFLRFALVFVCVMAVATVAMWRHASNFDETEIAALREIGGALLAGGGIAGIRDWWKRRGS